MRKVYKYPNPPQALEDKQAEIAQKLLEKKDLFSWRPEHYSDPIKVELKALYHNKCAFCERKLSDQDTDNRFTIEHYRPKAHYYWLGAEWTNLFPSCKTCNQKKDNTFSCLGRKLPKDATPFFDDQNRLIKADCLAHSPKLLAEKPLWLHPELDDAQKFFIFYPSGKADINPACTEEEQKRASETLNLLKLPIIEECRKKRIEEVKQDLYRCINIALDYEPKSDKEIQLCFGAFFQKLDEYSQAEAEFSALFTYAQTHFQAFFIEEIEAKFSSSVAQLVTYAHQNRK